MLRLVNLPGSSDLNADRRCRQALDQQQDGVLATFPGQQGGGVGAGQQITRRRKSLTPI